MTHQGPHLHIHFLPSAQEIPHEVPCLPTGFPAAFLLRSWVRSARVFGESTVHTVNVWNYVHFDESDVCLCIKYCMSAYTCEYDMEMICLGYDYDKAHSMA
jgi:hypothetical protein